MKIIPRRRVEVSIKEAISVFIKIYFTKTGSKNTVSIFEKSFSDYIGVEHSIAIPSARIGLSVLLDCLDLQDNDEIILSSYNFHVIPALLKNKKLKPVFVDIDLKSWNIDPSLVEEKITNKTKCLIATHLYGQSCDMAKLNQICKKHNILIIEDVAHACGGEYKGKKLGSLGDIAYHSFGTGKALVAYGGGMITSNNKMIIDKIAKHLKELKIDSPKNTFKNCIRSIVETIATKKIIFPVFIYPILFVIEHVNPGFIDKLTDDAITLEEGIISQRSAPFSNIQASFGLEQLNRLDDLNNKRICFAKTLNDLLQDIEELTIPNMSSDQKHISLYYCISAKRSEDLRRYLFFRGVDTKRGSMRACSALEFFKPTKPCVKAERLGSNTIELPCYPSLRIEDIYYQANIIRKFYNKEIKSYKEH